MTTAPLTEKQLWVLLQIDQTGRSGPPQAERNAFLGRQNTVQSLIARGLVQRAPLGTARWVGARPLLVTALRCGKRCATRGCRTPQLHPLGLKYCVPCAIKVSRELTVAALCARCRNLHRATDVAAELLSEMSRGSR